MKSKSLLMSRIFLTIAITFGIAYFYFLYLSDYLSLYRPIAIITISCNTISIIFRYMAYKIDGIEIRVWR